ncbi:MAG: M1 family metallopeptidase [Bacteroidota bacterium]
MRCLVCLAALTLVPAVFAQAPLRTSGGVLTTEQAAYDVTYYALDLRIEPADSTIEGTLTVEARVVLPTEVVVFDLDDALTVERVEEVAEVRAAGSMEWQEMALARRFVREPGTVRVHLGSTAQPNQLLRLRFTYGGMPRVAPGPPWDGGLTWARTEDGQPWVSVSCQIQGADLWWPTKDHPSDEPDSVRIALTVPADLRAIANGRYEGRMDNGDGTATERWFVSTPINNYGVSFGVAPYEIVEREYASPVGYTDTVQLYVLPENRADGERQLDGFLDAMAFLERTFGPYAWRDDGYKILHTPYLGMEHQSLVAYGSDWQDNEYGFDWLHFHELAHEWWANLATAPDWNDFWIHESFASYAEALYAEDIARRAGEDAEAAYLSYMAAKRPNHRNVIPVAPADPRGTQEMYQLADGRSNGDIYVKGAWVLHSIRFLMDDDPAFFSAMRSISYPDQALESVTDGRQARFVGYADVVRAFSLTTGVRTVPHLTNEHLQPMSLSAHPCVRSSVRLVIPLKGTAFNSFVLNIGIRIMK